MFAWQTLSITFSDSAPGTPFFGSSWPCATGDVRIREVVYNILKISVMVAHQADGEAYQPICAHIRPKDKNVNVHMRHNLILIAVHRVIWARVVCWRSCSVSYMQPQGWFEHLNYIGFVVNWGHVRATRFFCMKMLKLNSAVEETSAMRCCPYGLCTHIVDTCISLCPAFYLTCVHLHLVSPECICSQMGEYGPPSAWRATMTHSFSI